MECDDKINYVYGECFLASEIKRKTKTSRHSLMENFWHINILFTVKTIKNFGNIKKVVT